MSPRKSDPFEEPVPKAAPDVYVGLLFVAVASLIAGITFLVLELNRYDWKLP